MKSLTGLTTQALRFGVVGIAGTAVNAGSLAVLYGGWHWPFPLALSVATELAVLHNFTFNNRWTFGQRAVSLTRLVRYHLSSLTGLALALIATLLLVAGGAPYLLADLIGIAAGTISNFAISTRWTWRTLPRARGISWSQRRTRRKP